MRKSTVLRHASRSLAFSPTKLGGLPGTRVSCRRLSSNAEESPDAGSIDASDAKLERPGYQVPGYEDDDAGDLMHSMEKTNIQHYGENEFIVNGIKFRGSVLAFTNYSVLWKPASWKEVTVDSLRLLELVKPKPDLIVFGARSQVPRIHPEVEEYLRKLGIGFEVMKTWQAVATFTLLNEEDRRVAAALLSVSAEDMEEEQRQQDRMMNLNKRDWNAYSKRGGGGQQGGGRGA